MKRKLTITIDENVYNNLYVEIGRRKISKFIENLLRPYVIKNDLEKAYLEMANNKKQEDKALQWIEGVIDNDFNL